MRKFVMALVILGNMASAQQAGDAGRDAPAAKTDPKKPDAAAVARRLEVVTWDPLQAELTWFVSVWDLGSDMSKPIDLERYVIRMNTSVMESNGESRRFQVPAEDVHGLMDILSTYAMRSTIWWRRSGSSEEDSPRLLPDASDGVKN